MLQFTPLSGPYVGTHERPKALSYLIEVDQSRILLDCGAPEDLSFEADDLPSALERLGPTIDAVLLVHADMSHIGLYAYAYAHYGLRCPVYATLPVQTMGRLQMLETVHAWRQEDTQRYVPTEAEVDEAFDAIRALRYMQPTPLEGRCAGLVLTAYHAGHSLGGTVWKLRSPSVGTIVMALDWNHHRERHLDATALLAVGTAAAPLAHAIGRPDLLITDMERGLYTNARRKDRDAMLLDHVHRTLTSGHSVLLPVDGAPRLLELLVLLDQHWAFAYQHQRFPMCLVSHTGQEVVERARTFMEWMSREWAIQFLDAPSRRKAAAAPKSPLDFSCLRFYSSVDALRDALPASQPKLVLATPPALSHGLARQLLPEFLSDPEAMVLLTSRGDPSSLGRTLWDRWNAAQPDVEAWHTGHVGVPVSVGGHLALELRRQVPLAGDELRAYMERVPAPAPPVRAMHRGRDADEDADESDSSDDDVAPVVSDDMSFDIFLRGQRRDAMHFRLFPHIERKRRMDGYGEWIDTSRWLAKRKRLEAEQEAQLDPTPAPAPAPAPAMPIPTKLVSDTVHADMRCRLLYIDMQGLSDGRALTTLVPQLQPRRLILVNGDPATHAALDTKFRGTLGDALYMPPVGSCVALGGLAHSYTVRLGDALMSHLRWRPMQDYQIVHLHVAPNEDDTPTLVPVQDASTLHAAQAPSTLYVGDLRLSALKAYLARQHRLRADFAGEGMLVCGDRDARNVTVTKDGAGRIVVDGTLSPNLARVRQSIYQLVAQVHQ